VFPINKWVALTRASLCVVCVVDYPAISMSATFAFHKVERRHYLGEVSEFFQVRNFPGKLYTKNYWNRFRLKI